MRDRTGAAARESLQRALAGSSRLRSTLAAEPDISAHIDVTVAKTSSFIARFAHSWSTSRSGQSPLVAQQARYHSLSVLKSCASMCLLQAVFQLIHQKTSLASQSMSLWREPFAQLFLLLLALCSLCCKAAALAAIVKVLFLEDRVQ